MHENKRVYVSIRSQSYSNSKQMHYVMHGIMLPSMNKFTAIASILEIFFIVNNISSLYQSHGQLYP